MNNLDVLFIYPPLSVNERYGNKRLGNVGGNMPPLGIAHLAAVCRKEGYQAGIIDGPALQLTEDDIIARINLLQPKVVGISAITPIFHRATGLANLIRNRFPDILIIVGGHHISIMPARALAENASFDIAVYGEGEVTIAEILKNFKSHGFNRKAFCGDQALLKEIKGIVYRHDSGVEVTPPRPAIKDLDILPFPAWDLLPMNNYIPLPNQYLNQPVINMFVVRGCPFDCSFCSNAVFGHGVRAMSPGRVFDTIEHVKRHFGIKEISFWDDCLTVNKAWLLELCNQFITKRANVTWTCYSRVDTIDKEMLIRMKEAGCWNIFYGYEAGDQNLLNMIDKKITLDRIRTVNRWTKEAGIEVRASFMLALPGETPALARKTIDFAIELNPDYVQFTLTTPHPHTRLYEEAAKHGKLAQDLSRFNHWEPVFIPSGYKNGEEIIKVQRRAFLRFYLRPQYIWGRLKKIRSASDILRYLKGLRLLFGFVKKQAS